MGWGGHEKKAKMFPKGCWGRQLIIIDNKCAYHREAEIHFWVLLYKSRLYMLKIWGSMSEVQIACPLDIICVP